MPLRKRAAAAAGDTVLMEHALRWNELFSRWPEDRRYELLKAARLERYSRRTQVLAHDRNRRELLAVVSGCLEISSLSSDGRKYLNAFLGPGQVAPLVRLLEDVPQAYDYCAHEDSVIVHLPCDAVIGVLDQNPALWRDVAWLALKRQRMSLAMLRAYSVGSIRRRVAATLLNLAEIYGAATSDGTDLRVRFTQHDLAAMLGLSRQTINKELGAFTDAGVIEMAYKRLILRDKDTLRRFAAED